jgi:hypothetical protein
MAAWIGISKSSGDIVYEKGEAGSSMYIVARGMATVSKSLHRRHDIGPGSFFGEVQALGIDSQRQETVRAKTALHLLEVHHDSITSLLKRKKVDWYSPPDCIENSEEQPQLQGAPPPSAMMFPEERRHFEMYRTNLFRAQCRRKQYNVAASPHDDGDTFHMTSISDTSDIGVGQTRRKNLRRHNRKLMWNVGESLSSSAESQHPSLDRAHVQTCQSFMTKLVESLRDDKKSRFMLPKGLRFGSKNEPTQKGSAGWKTPNWCYISSAGPESNSCAETPTNSRSMFPEEEEALGQDTLELELLPPLELLSPLQKQTLLKQLQAHLKVRSRPTPKEQVPMVRMKQLFKAGPKDANKCEHSEDCMDDLSNLSSDFCSGF